VAPRATLIAGTVAEWEEWTGISFPNIGAYIVPSALQPITVDRERNIGSYEAPNGWMWHSTMDAKTA